MKRTETLQVHVKDLAIGGNNHVVIQSMCNIKTEKVNEVVAKLKSDDKLRAQFMKEPVKTLEQILGVDLPDDVIEKIVNAVKVNLTAEDIGDLVGAAMKIFKR